MLRRNKGMLTRPKRRNHTSSAARVRIKIWTRAFGMIRVRVRVWPQCVGLRNDVCLLYKYQKLLETKAGIYYGTRVV